MDVLACKGWVLENEFIRARALGESFENELDRDSCADKDGLSEHDTRHAVNVSGPVHLLDDNNKERRLS